MSFKVKLENLIPAELSKKYIGQPVLIGDEFARIFKKGTETIKRIEFIFTKAELIEEMIPSYEIIAYIDDYSDECFPIKLI